MRTHTTSIQIAASPEASFDFLADGTTLPRWAIGFAKAIERAGEDWVVTLGSGERMPLRIAADRRCGVIDFLSELPAHSRVLPHAGATLYTFTMHQAPEIPDEAFDAQIAELERELTVLKAHLETACPL
jgi:hypothetical protein